MKKMCFSTVVYGWYQDFIPIYIYSILSEFPHHYVKIFLKDELSDGIAECLDLLPKNSFQIIEKFNDLEQCNVNGATERFLLTEEYFEGFDYVYLGDVDFIIFNQFSTKNFFDYYVDHCNSTGLPFSNSCNYDKYRGRKRVTGLHFIINKTYFKTMHNTIVETKKELSNRLNKYDSFLDEEILYEMLSQKLDLTKITHCYLRPLNGLHFGKFRKDYINFNRLLTNSSRKQMLGCIKKFIAILDSDIYQKCSKIMCDEAKDVINKAKHCFILS